MKLPFEGPESIGDGMWLLPGFAHTYLLKDPLKQVCEEARPRQMVTPWGKPMSVSVTNTGDVGWVSDPSGYRYSSVDPETNASWPAMPKSFWALAVDAAAAVGVGNYQPDTCLINRYRVGTQMGAHQDSDERDFDQPIVSVSLGLEAVFFFKPNIVTTRSGKGSRIGPTESVRLHDGDVLVFGGPLRRCYHGVRKIRPGHHADFGATRWNLTFRKAL